MSTINDGGSAFPIFSPIAADGYPAAGYPFPESGMSLRDFFAGLALNGWAAGRNSAMEASSPSRSNRKRGVL